MLTLAQIHGQPEIFHSIQGEGVSQGTPCVFLRLAGCNLACSWCDTAYSWNGTAPGVRLAPEKAAELVLHYPCRRLVLTGGEPLIQQKALPALLRLLPDHAVEMETNGTIMPDTELLKRVTQFNVSPKLPHSGNNDVKTWKPDILRCLAGTEKAWFKFVVACEDDVRAVLQRASEADIPPERILIMPLASTRDELNAMRPQAVEWCLRYGLRFQTVCISPSGTAKRRLSTLLTHQERQMLPAFRPEFRKPPRLCAIGKPTLSVSNPAASGYCWGICSGKQEPFHGFYGFMPG